MLSVGVSQHASSNSKGATPMYGGLILIVPLQWWEEKGREEREEILLQMSFAQVYSLLNKITALQSELHQPC